MVAFAGETTAAGVHAALEWNKADMGRRCLRQKVARLKEQRRLAETNKWAGRNSRSAKLQVVLNQALDEWFQFARKGLRGVPVPDLVDSIIMLGLNHDHRQVQRTVLGEVDTSDGLLTLRGFTTALLASCSSEYHRDRLVRALRGGQERRRLPVDHKDDGSAYSKARTEGGAAMSAGVPVFVEQLTVHRRKVLMETVADKFPTSRTSCTPTFGVSEDVPPPKACCITEGVQQPASPDKVVFTSLEASPTLSDEARRRCKAVWEAVIVAQERDLLAGQDLISSKRGVSGSSGGGGRGGVPQKRRPQNGHPKTTNEPCCRPDSSIGGEKNGDRTVAEISAVGGSPAETKGRNTGCHLPRRSQRQHMHQQYQQRQYIQQHHQQLGGRGQACRIGPRATVQRSASSRPKEFHSEVREARTAGGGATTTTYDEDWRAEVLRETAGRLRESARQKELGLASTEARWDNYQAMKKRWWRHTPLSILQGDEPDEENRSYSRISRPRTSEGTGSDGHYRASASASRCAASSCRPSTAPESSSSSSFFTETIISNNIVTCSGGSSSSRCPTAATKKKRTVIKPLPLGPISVNAGKKLPYPLEQLLQQDEKAEFAGGGYRGGGGVRLKPPTGRRSSSRDFVEVPVVTRRRKRDWQPHLARVPCGFKTSSS